MFAHLQEWRLYEAAHPLLVAVAAISLTGHHIWDWRVLLLCFAILTGWIAGLYLGDYLGRGQDALVKPHRPIPSGRITARTATLCALGCASAGCLVILVINWHGLIIVALMVGAYCAYNVFLKSHGIVGDVVEALSTSVCVFLVGTTFGASWPPLHLVPVATVFLLQASFSNVALALTDIEGDRRVGWHTLPVRRGVPTTLVVLVGIGALQLILAALAPVYLPDIGYVPVFGLFLLSSTALTATSILILATAPRPLARTDALRAFEYHLIDKAVLPGAFIALATGPLPALALTGAGVLLTWPAARTLLYRYELGRPRPTQPA